VIPASRNRGFTLLEVLVATTIIALALGAIIRSTATGTANLTYLRDKTLAHWVAANQMAALQGEPRFPAVGRSSGEEELGGREWLWHREVKETPDKDVRRIEIRVQSADAEGETPLATLTGFIGRP
jgi:general secretion pathway protein I